MDNINLNDWIGPFLMKPTSTSMGFWVYKDNPPFGDMKIVIKDKYGEIIDELLMQRADNSLSESAIYTIESKNNLNADTEYHYFLQDMSGKELYSSTFRTLPDFLKNPNQAFNFFLMSCHGVEQYEKDHPEGDAWHMWKILNEVYDTEPNCYIAILAGDQVYMDDKFEGRIEKFKEEDKQKIEIDALRVYKKYWSNEQYRKFLSRVPSFLMWDDHDLIDGFGSRQDSFERKTSKLKPGWEIYRDVLKNVFEKMQASRNPVMIGDKNNGYSVEFPIGDLSFLTLDLRSHRNIKGAPDGSGIMLSDEHKNELGDCFNRLEKNDAVNTVFIVSPVTVARMGGKIERDLGRLANGAWRISYVLTRFYNKSGWRVVPWVIASLVLLNFFICSCCWVKVIFLLLFLLAFLMTVLEASGLLDELAGLDDDINDAWSSEANAKELDWLAKHINRLLAAGKKVVVLSGDIHTGGLTNLILTEHVVPQIISSPISYTPMWPLIEKLTSGYNRIKLPEKDSVCEAENIFFTCKRNFALCKTYKDKNSKRRVDVEFYFENAPRSVKLYDL